MGMNAQRMPAPGMPQGTMGGQAGMAQAQARQASPAMAQMRNPAQGAMNRMMLANSLRQRAGMPMSAAAQGAMALMNDPQMR